MHDLTPYTPIPHSQVGLTSPSKAGMEHSFSIAAELQRFAQEKKLTTQIQGKQYMNVSGWQFALSLLGVTSIVRETKSLCTDTEFKYYARVELVRLSDQTIVGAGDAICTNKEQKKKTFDEYAILSMAQTRAIGKAARNFCGWLSEAAGYDSTPLEEIEGVIDQVSSTADIVALHAKHGKQILNNPELLEQIKKKKAQIMQGETDYDSNQD